MERADTVFGPDLPNLLIAATAVRHALPLATRNARAFHHLGRVLAVIDFGTDSHPGRASSASG